MSGQKHELTRKDRKILKELFEDGRASFAVIGRKTRLSKETVHYRVNQLLKWCIFRFSTIIDVRKLGWESFFVYVRFKNIDLDAEKRVIEYLNEQKNVSWVVRTVGPYDFIIKLFTRNVEETNEVVKRFEACFEGCVDSCVVDYLAEECAVPFSFLYEKEKQQLHTLGKVKRKTEVTHEDLLILKSLAGTARKSITKIMDETGLTRDVAVYRFKKLEKEKIIQQYRPEITWGLMKLGYVWYLLSLKVGNIEKSVEKKVNQFLLDHPQVSYFYRTIGSKDMHIEIKVTNTSQLNEALMGLRSILKGSLKRFDVCVILEEHKYTYFPKCLEETPTSS